MNIDTKVIDKKSENRLKYKVFLCFSVVTLLISSLFVFEGYFASLEFGRKIENVQLHNNAEQVIKKINSLQSTSDENSRELINIVDHYHTNSRSAVVFVVNKKNIYSRKKFPLDELQNVVIAVKKKVSIVKVEHMKQHSISINTHVHCEDDDCIIKYNDFEYNWMIHKSNKYGDVILIQQSNIASFANSIVFVRLLSSSMVVIWIGLWASFAIAIFIARMVKKSNDLKLYPLYHDLNTGLLNNKSLLEKLMSVRHLDSNVRDCSLVLISIDNIDTIEYNYGHIVKEMFLKVLADRLSSSGSKYYVGVFQSNIYYLLSINVMQNIIYRDLKVIVNSISEPIFIDGIQFVPSIRQGIVNFDSTTFATNEVIGNARFALNRAKLSRSRGYTYSPKISDETKKKNELMNDLIHAIENDEFVLHYQPKIDLNNQSINSVESLVRWQHPTRGLLYPIDFIDLIENSIIAGNFTQHLIQIALKQSAVWWDQGLKLTIAVNVSPYDLEDEEFVNFIIRLHNDGKLRKNAIEVELTEIDNSVDIKHVAKMLTLLQGVNVKCAIDDFGTGMSSLTYLKYIPVNTVKIDRSFVMDLETNLASKAIVESTIKLANELGCNVVAEGIESVEIANQLASLGCEFGQGYFFSKPLSGDDLQYYVLENKNTTPEIMNKA